jgi:predicted transcriptional regulator
LFRVFQDVYGVHLKKVGWSGMQTGKARQKREDVADSNKAAWTFLTNHSHVLLLIVRDPEMRMRDLAAQVGITERAVQRIIDELERGGYITIDKQGRRNHYRVVQGQHLRHPVEAQRTVGDLVRMVYRH